MSNRTHPLRKHIAQLEAEVQVQTIKLLIPVWQKRGKYLVLDGN
jgi:hypothetical protein